MAAKRQRRPHKTRSQPARPREEDRQLPPDRVQLSPQERVSENFETDVAPDRVDAGMPDARKRDDSVCGTPSNER